MSPDYSEFWIRYDEWGKLGLLPEWARDRQDRSRATRGRILEAAAALLLECPCAAVSIKDIASRAGISVGAVYARFPSKDAILLMLLVVTVQDICDDFERTLDDLASPATFRDLAGAYVATVIRALERHRVLITEARRHAGGEPSLGPLLGRTNSLLHEAFLNRARPYAPEVRHSDPESCLAYALFTVSAAAREAVLSGALVAYSVEGSEEELICELTDVMCRYVGVEGA